ncbi:MAG: methyltransferase domain-containing protein [Pirellulaceae bacterium]|nr:methyltransferase domain-containing protein [Pirellulaceae bacterium]
MDDPHWLNLKTEIERSVKLESTTIQLGERSFEWYRVAEPDQLLEAAVASQLPAEDVDPFWAASWRAARGLDRFLQRLNCQGLRILELGCGSGQAGVAAAARGVQVVMTDAVPLALQVARLNAWPVSERIRFQVLKWGQQRLASESFPIVIGSDLVYDPALFPKLEACARQHLEPDGRLLLSEPHRHTGDKFASWIVDAGWRIEQHDVHLDDQRVPIRIFDCYLP